ncbi:hypothetical protein HDU78_000010 [Chytriomyces hyalinus]|nr:hypothetical protein HDU78_000010 [Chytriomyces hyalinus]KAJ3265305.1 hypothetical protein HDU77_005751 [Chytriomyces hyalinus]
MMIPRHRKIRSNCSTASSDCGSLPRHIKFPEDETPALAATSPTCTSPADTSPPPADTALNACMLSSSPPASASLTLHNVPCMPPSKPAWTQRDEDTLMAQCSSRRYFKYVRAMADADALAHSLEEDQSQEGAAEHSKDPEPVSDIVTVPPAAEDQQANDATGDATDDHVMQESDDLCYDKHGDDDGYGENQEEDDFWGGYHFQYNPEDDDMYDDEDASHPELSGDGYDYEDSEHLTRVDQSETLDQDDDNYYDDEHEVLDHKNGETLENLVVSLKRRIRKSTTVQKEMQLELSEMNSRLSKMSKILSRSARSLKRKRNAIDTAEVSVEADMDVLAGLSESVDVDSDGAATNGKKVKPDGYPYGSSIAWTVGTALVSSAATVAAIGLYC